MAFFVRPLTANEEKIINSLKTRHFDDAVLLARLDIILLSNQRWKSGKIAQQLQVGRETVIRWIQRFNQLGLDCFKQYLSAGLEEAATAAEQDGYSLFVRSLTFEEQAYLQELLEVYQNSPRTIKHLQTIELSSLGLTIPEIAVSLGFSRRTFWRVRFWIEQFNSQGVASLETTSDRNWLNQQFKTNNTDLASSDSIILETLS